jgi:hypothetical protein
MKLGFRWLSNTDVEKLHLPSSKTFLDLCSFAQEHEIYQLRQDLMTITVELSNADPTPRGDNWEDSEITRVITYPFLDGSELPDFIVLEVSLGNLGRNDVPMNFFAMLSDYLLEDRDIEARVARVTDCCSFHNHWDIDGAVDRKCKDRRIKEGDMFAGFLKACLDAAAADDERIQ